MEKVSININYAYSELTENEKLKTIGDEWSHMSDVDKNVNNLRKRNSNGMRKERKKN